MTQEVSRRALIAAALAAPALIAARGERVQPSWPSLVQQYRYPDWFRDAKFGIWSHWGPQAVPEQGDWYGDSCTCRATRWRTSTARPTATPPSSG